jgi:OOP family OmpA-OmpF porin
MKSVHALRLLTLAGVGSLLAASSFAQDSYYYGGLSVGKSHTPLDEQAISTRQLPLGVAASGFSSKPNDTGYKVFGGYQFNRNLALEVGYLHLGQSGFSATTTPAGTLDGNIQVQGANIDVVGLLPFSDRFSALARVGAHYARTLGSFTGTDGALPLTDATPSWRKGNYKVGLGLQYAFSPSVLLRGEAERYRINDANGHNTNADLITVGLVFPFGRAEAPAPRTSAAPAYREPVPVAAAPAPQSTAPSTAPVQEVAVVPLALPAPERKRVSYTAESMFSFDKADLRPEGKTALDAFAGELAGARFEKITVEGYTDRIGSTAYNQTLSQQRADAVKAYLVSAGGLDAAKITAVGLSESGAITKPEDCRGSSTTPALVNCLQPDRRVEIEVSGTR